MLAEHVEHYSLAQYPDAPPPAVTEPDENHPHCSEMPSFYLSTFYTVAIANDGNTIEIINPQKTVHSDTELESLAHGILSGGKTTG